MAILRAVSPARHEWFGRWTLAVITAFTLIFASAPLVGCAVDAGPNDEEPVAQVSSALTVAAPTITSPGSCATVAGQTSAALSWTVSSTNQISVFTIDVKPAAGCNGATTGGSVSGFPKTVGVASSASTTLTGLQANTWYKYSVESTATAGNTSNNTVGWFKTAAATITVAAPTITSPGSCATVAGQTSTTLSWTVASTNQISVFTIDVKPAAGCNGATTGGSVSGFPKTVGVASSASTTLTGLQADTWYKYSVESTATAGNTSNNTVGWFKTAAATITVAAPTITSPGSCATVPGQTSAALSWTVSSTNQISVFTIDVKPAAGCNGATTGGSVSGFPKTVAVASSASTTLTGLQAGTWYKYSVESTATAGNTSNNAVGWFQTAGTAITVAAPTITSPGSCATVPGQTSAALSWTVSSTNQISVFTIDVKPAAGCNGATTGGSVSGFPKTVAVASSASTTLTGLQAGTWYKYSVESTATAGNTSNNAVGWFQTAGTAITVAAPTITSPGSCATVPGQTSAALSWTVSSTNQISVFTIDVKPAAGCNGATTGGSVTGFPKTVAVASSASTTLTGLQAGTWYKYSVESTATAGNTSNNAVGWFLTTTAGGITVAAATVTSPGSCATVPGQTSAALSWTVSSTIQISVFTIDVKPAAGCNGATTGGSVAGFPKTVAVASSASTTLTGLQAGTWYKYSVESTATAGNTSNNTVGWFQTTIAGGITVAAATVTSPGSCATVPGQTSTSLSWTVSSTNQISVFTIDVKPAAGCNGATTGGSVTGFPKTVAVASSASTTLTGLQAGTWYKYSVESTATAGNTSNNTVGWFQTGGAPSCGNGQVDPAEECDGGLLNGQTCVGLGYSGGALSCSNCTFDISACTSPATCGNGQVDPAEDCDGSLLNGQTCASLGYSGGALSCSNCSFNTLACTNPPNCGNGKLDFGEACDANLLNGTTCISLGYEGGVLSCYDDCTAFDTSACIDQKCGNGQLDPGEACDGALLNNQTCSTLGYPYGGQVTCKACSSFDESECCSSPSSGSPLGIVDSVSISVEPKLEVLGAGAKVKFVYTADPTLPSAGKCEFGLNASAELDFCAFFIDREFCAVNKLSFDTSCTADSVCSDPPTASCDYAGTSCCKTTLTYAPSLSFAIKPELGVEIPGFIGGDVYGIVQTTLLFSGSYGVENGIVCGCPEGKPIIDGSVGVSGGGGGGVKFMLFGQESDVEVLLTVCGAIGVKADREVCGGPINANPTGQFKLSGTLPGIDIGWFHIDAQPIDLVNVGEGACP